MLEQAKIVFFNKDLSKLEYKECFYEIEDLSTESDFLEKFLNDNDYFGYMFFYNRFDSDDYFIYEKEDYDRDYDKLTEIVKNFIEKNCER